MLAQQVEAPCAGRSACRAPARRSSGCRARRDRPCPIRSSVRSSIAALPIGTISSSRARVMTKPPTCCDRWRGKPMSSSASVSACFRRGSSGSRPMRRISFGVDLARPPAPDRARQRRDAVVRQAERLADFAHGRARAIGDDGGGEPGALAAVALVDVLHHLFAPLMLEIDVDVGRLVALGEMKRSNRRSCLVGSTSVMPRQKQTAELAAEPRPWHRMPRPRAKRTMSWTVRK